jgi:hypothetical protein
MSKDGPARPVNRLIIRRRTDIDYLPLIGWLPSWWWICGFEHPRIGCGFRWNNTYELIPQHAHAGLVGGDRSSAGWRFETWHHVAEAVQRHWNDEHGKVKA